MNEKERFIAELYSAAIEVSEDTGMAWQTILAQAAQETGWGRHQLPGAHNIFNIKADPGWRGPSQAFNVWEIENGQKVWRDQSFRMYGSYEEALLDRVEFLRDNPRYAKAGLFDEGTKGNFEKEAAALQRAGYATDPHYAAGLVRVFNSPTMQHAIKEARALTATRNHAPGIRPQHAVYQYQQACLTEGAQGFAVATLQAELSKLGYSGDRGHPLKADGEFGIRTRHAVERFQHDHHLTVDGKVGPLTREAMHSALQQSASPSSLTDMRHPDHALFAQALAGVRALDARGQPTEQQRLNLAAAMVVEARLQGLTRIDQVVLGDDGSRVYIAQHPTSFMEQTKIGSVDTVAALQTPVARSSELAASPRSSSAVSLAPIIQPPAPTQTMVV
ncbi:glucosaminidase domain-containing protein [Rhodanobacter caeni]|uniref:Mannosyl-glycoprotein endo-beta-N-acetylglucosamidase-like domain-containing protein n=1 Tax=Rhodanobacter caeni TaxID=657654 RepID=A0ABP3EA55_9GAMM